jgi:hypothetical protein
MADERKNSVSKDREPLGSRWAEFAIFSGGV